MQLALLCINVKMSLDLICGGINVKGSQVSNIWCLSCGQ